MGPRRAPSTRWRLPIAAAAGVIVAVAGLILLRCVYVALRSRLSTDPLADPHGYELIAGTVLVFPAAAVVAVVAPFLVAPGPDRARLAKTVTILLVVLTPLPLIALLTA
ncbi:hypothetical protein ACFWM1_17540 [Nocardia sp. NPDC058379]|uniref:hypothetical protein n=1 Tax=unclassified Nocardia TaxID=2637762 RepID=UPI0036500A22